MGVIDFGLVVRYIHPRPSKIRTTPPSLGSLPVVEAALPLFVGEVFQLDRMPSLNRCSAKTDNQSDSSTVQTCGLRYVSFRQRPLEVIAAENQLRVHLSKLATTPPLNGHLFMESLLEPGPTLNHSMTQSTTLPCPLDHKSQEHDPSTPYPLPPCLKPSSPTSPIRAMAKWLG